MNVIKRNGTTVPFEEKKIENAVARAFIDTGEIDVKSIPTVASAVTMMIVTNLKESKNDTPTVEQLQDMVEATLMKFGYNTTAKSYILYRDQHQKARQAKNTLLDYKKLVEGYIGENKDWRVKENSTVTLSVGALILSNSGAITANYWLSEIYDEAIAEAHKNCFIHIHDLSMLTGYCAGWNLKQLIQEGLGGVPDRISSSPAKHLSTLCNQMVNFLGIMQNEWAGAQAFSSFDTYLAPFVKAENLDYKQVKQCVQSFIYGVNTPSRWGCVDTDTEVLSENGFKKYNELKEGDMIYTWNNGRLELNPVRKVIQKAHNGKLHSYKGRYYNQTVTPNHRMLIYKHNSDETTIKRSEEIFDAKTAHALPVAFKDSNIVNNDLTNEEIALAAMVYTDGNFDYRNGNLHKISIYKSPKRFGNKEIVEIFDKLGIKYSKLNADGQFGPVNKYVVYSDDAKRIEELVGSKDKIASKFMTMSMEQANLFLKTWASFDGDEDKMLCQYDNDIIRDQLQQIAILAGHCSYLSEAKLDSGNTTKYVKVRKFDRIYPTDRTEIDYNGIVWCPNVENGTAVFRKNGSVYISGQTQAPFTNVTLDWTVPEDLKDMPAIVGGKEMDFTYGDCKKEMDMINKAFIETMIEGDANGRGFQYPIPTYSITKEFDWSETENNKLLFEMTAKYGTPYFSNYVNSDMKPSDIRSMCPLAGKEKVLVKDEFSKEFHISTIENLYKSGNKSGIYEIVLNGKIKKAVINRFDNQKFYKIKTINGHEITLSGSHANLVYGNNIKRTDELTLEDYLPFNITALEGKGLSYEDGLLVGAFMGDGSVKDDYAITYSLNETTKKDLMNEIIRIATEKYGAKYKINKLENNCTNLVVTSRIIRGLISEYVSGKSTEKELNVKCIDKSLDFRKGILDGYMQTDGGNKLRIYSASKKAVDSLVTMLMSMGIPSRISVDDRDNTKTLSNNPVYAVKLYEENDKRNTYGDVFKKDENYMWFRIESIEEIKNGAHLGYCFQVLDDEEPYFTLPCGLVTHNCRLRLDLRELRKKGGGFFGSGESTGSVGVVTLNLPRIAYLSKTKEEFYAMLNKYMDIAARSLSIKRKVITRLMDEGLYPYTKRYLGSFKNHFSTIGIVGMNEAILNAKWLPNETIATEKGHEFALEVLKHMRNRLADYQEKYVGDLYNLEATPAESTAYRFAKHDTEDYPDIITAASEGNAPYYTNSTHLPVGYTDDIFEALELEDDMQTMYTSGTVFHGFLGERLPDWKSAATLVRKIANNFKLPYYTLSPTYSVCAEHGYITGEHFKCPKCGRDAEVYSRITGYYRPVRNWNDGKASEFVNRKTYDTENDIKQENAKREMPITEETPDKKLHDAAKCVAAKVDATAPESIASNGKRFLVSTKTCPKCVFIKKQLETAGLRFTPLYAEDKEGAEIAQKYNISSVPVLVDETGSEPVLYPFEKINQYIKEHQDE